MQTKNEPSFLTLLLMISFAVGNAVLITPALPAITNYFGVTDAITQYVITWYLVGYAIGQLFYGPLANRFGRKPTLYMGVGLQIVSSFICVLAALLHQYPLLVFGRFTLALGAGVGLKMAFTIVNEFYEPKVVSQKVSYLMMAFAITPGVSMAIGGILNDKLGWISCLYASAVYGLLLFPLLTKLPETQLVLDQNALKIKHLLHSYVEQFKNIQLFCGGILMGLTTCFIYVFATIAPFVAIDLLKMSSQSYGIASLLPSLGYVIGGILSAQLAKKYPLTTTIKIGIVIIILGILLMYATTMANLSALFSLFIPVSFIYFGESLIYPNVSAIAMSAVTDKSHASAVMNFLTIGLPTIAILTIGLFSINTMLIPMIFTVLCVAVICTFKWVTMGRK